MVDEQTWCEKSIQDFFTRSGLSIRDYAECYTFIERNYPGVTISSVPSQGYCSLTVYVGDDLVIQFRPDKYRLDLRVTAAARYVYGSYAPTTRYAATISNSGLLVYSMERIKGISLRDFRLSSMGRRFTFEKRAMLCKDFAAFLARGWSQSVTAHIQKGTVGGSIASRLEALRVNLPVRFQAKVRVIIDNLALIEALPWILSHGDIVLGNIIVDPFSGRLLGLVDWAEAEYFPFGVCLYGLEEFLGETTTTGFQYSLDASALRNIFWEALTKAVPDLCQVQFMKAVGLARDLGVLLWYGIAFDNGAINRVVQEGRDVDEIKRLDLWLPRQYTPGDERTNAFKQAVGVTNSELQERPQIRQIGPGVTSISGNYGCKICQQ